MVEPEQLAFRRGGGVGEPARESGRNFPVQRPEGADALYRSLEQGELTTLLGSEARQRTRLKRDLAKIRDRYGAETPLGRRRTAIEEQAAAPAAVLQRTFRRALRNGPDAAIDSAEVVSLFGFETRSCKTAGDVWRHFLERHFEGPAELEAPLDVILTEGTLAERILGALGADFDARDLALVYRRLSQSLVDDRPFRA